LAAARALDQKIAAAGSGTEIVDQIREAGGRAPASSQRISMAGVVHPTDPDGDEEHRSGRCSNH
jgi:hypothetical protein